MTSTSATWQTCLEREVFYCVATLDSEMIYYTMCSFTILNYIHLLFY